MNGMNGIRLDAAGLNRVAGSAVNYQFVSELQTVKAFGDCRFVTKSDPRPPIKLGRTQQKIRQLPTKP
jgi:hypothetical protein